jgi:hypothetical protein
MKSGMKTLLVDNYDSFTFNVAQALEVANGSAPIVVRNDECTYDEIAAVLVGSDATCLVPEWGVPRAALGPRTVVCTYWIRLAVGVAPSRRDILLFIDQLDPDQWAQLRALLERARCDAAHALQGLREPI